MGPASVWVTIEQFRWRLHDDEQYLRRKYGMSWSVSAGGKKVDVHAAIDQQIDPTKIYPGSDQALEFERARVALHSLVDSLNTTHVTLSANGHYTSATVNCSGYNEVPINVSGSVSDPSKAIDAVVQAQGVSGSGGVGSAE